MKKIYLASPFFNDQEVERMEKVRDILRNRGFEVFVPKENQHPEYEFGTKEWRKATFNGDVSEINKADIIVSVICNGNYEDGGTSWELGYAYALKKPVVAINVTGEILNLMIADSVHAYLSSYEALETYDFDKLDKIDFDGEVL